MRPLSCTGRDRTIYKRLGDIRQLKRTHLKNCLKNPAILLLSPLAAAAAAIASGETSAEPDSESLLRRDEVRRERLIDSRSKEE